MRVAVTGATGVIGSALVEALRERGDEPVALSRDAERAKEALGVEAFEWKNPKAEPAPLDALRGSDAVVNLLGETIAQRWSDDIKREIRDSRILTTRNLVAALRELPEGERPRVLVSQSASGWYGARGEERLDEAEPAGERLPRPGHSRLGGGGGQGRGARYAGRPAAHRRRPVRVGRRAREDAALLQARHRRSGGGRAPVRALDSPRRRGRGDPVRARQRRRPRPRQRDRARAGDEQGAVGDARPRAAQAGLRSGSRRWRSRRSTARWPP